MFILRIKKLKSNIVKETKYYILFYSFHNCLFWNFRMKLLEYLNRMNFKTILGVEKAIEQYKKAIPFKESHHIHKCHTKIQY